MPTNIHLHKHLDNSILLLQIWIFLSYNFAFFNMYVATHTYNFSEGDTKAFVHDPAIEKQVYLLESFFNFVSVFGGQCLAPGCAVQNINCVLCTPRTQLTVLSCDYIKPPNRCGPYHLQFDYCCTT